MKRISRALPLAAAATTAVVGIIGPVSAATAAPTSPQHREVAAATAAAAENKYIFIANDDQDNGYYCGPAAVRNALSGRKYGAYQSDLARELGTTTNGTASIYDVTRVLNRRLNTTWYQSKMIPGSYATQAQKDLLKRDVVLDINSGYVLVANVVGTVRDTVGGTHSYPGGHYLDIVGYNHYGNIARLYDVANNTFYDVTISALADWIGTRGYSA